MNKSKVFFEGVAKDLGLSIKIPRSNKTVQKISIITNSAVGVGLIITGVVVSSKALIGLGALGLVGAAVLAKDK